MTAMERVCTFLKEAGTYYLATVDGDQPRVRPFGTIHIFEGKLYIQTGRRLIPKLRSALSKTAYGSALQASLSMTTA